MKKIFAVAAVAVILSACGSDNSNDEAEDQAAVAEALEEQQVQAAQSMQERWNDRTRSDEGAEKDGDETATREE